MQGWIYVLVNSSMPGLAKVGRTTKSPASRAAELSGATGVATPFVLAFDQAFADCCAAEKAVHDELDRRGLRVAPNREFFHGSPSDVVRVVLDAAEAAGHWVPATIDTSAQSLLAVGDRCLFGIGDTLQDTGEATRCYKLAAARGSLLAYERLGRIFAELYVEHPDRAGRRRAMAPLKEGARRGNYYCYAEMATLFAVERHLDNFCKAWDLFFAARARGRLSEIEPGPERTAAACCRYISGCLGVGIDPGHRAELLPVTDDLIAVLLSELDRVREDAATRRRVTAVLLWIYRSLLPPMALPAPLKRRRVSLDPRAWLPAKGVRVAASGWSGVHSG